MDELLREQRNTNTELGRLVTAVEAQGPAIQKSATALQIILDRSNGSSKSGNGNGFRSLVTVQMLSAVLGGMALVLSLVFTMIATQVGTHNAQLEQQRQILDQHQLDVLPIDTTQSLLHWFNCQAIRRLDPVHACLSPTLPGDNFHQP